MQNVLTVEEVFSRRMLRVPDYQRGYAWEKRNWQEFVDDIELLENGHEHYTGTLVLHPGRDTRKDEEKNTYDVAEIVDGQQRLTTIVLLLDAIRRDLMARNPQDKVADGIRRQYIFVRDPSGQPAYKLTLNADTDAFFRKQILEDQPHPGGPTIQSERRLQQAHGFFREWLAAQKQKHGDGYDAWLDELLDKLTTRLKLSLYTVSKEAEVGVVFEVMNNRGKPLTELEKVKNYLLYLSTKLRIPGEALASAVNAAWRDVFKNLAAAGLSSAHHEDQLLRAHWIYAYNHDASAWDGSRSIKNRFQPRVPDHKQLLADAIAYADGLRSASLAYRDVVNPTDDAAFRDPGLQSARSEIVRWSQKLIRLDVVAPFLPLLLATRVKQHHDGEGYAELVKTCERFAFRVYRFGEFRSQTGQNMLYRLAFEQFHGKKTPAAVLAEIRARLLGYHSAAKFEAELKLQDRDEDNNWYAWSGLRYFLYEYEEHTAGKNALALKWETVETQELAKTIEHVLPQSPKDPYWTERFTPQDRRRLTHDIGNLTLTEYNSPLSNKPFPEKRGKQSDGSKCYANSGVFIERALVKYEDWTPETIQQRREEIVAWAKERWSVEGGQAALAGAGHEDDDAKDESAPA